MRTMLKPVLAMGVVVVSLLTTATSCDKKAGAGGGSGNNFSGRTGDLELAAGSDASSFVKIKDNTVYISAAGLANKLTPLSDADDANRSYDDLIDANTAASNLRDVSYTKHLFNIYYSSAPAAMIFVNRSHVTKDNITFRNFNDCSDDSESADNAFAEAAGGGTCRFYKDNGSRIFFYDGLGTTFDNTKTASRARGIMKCHSDIYRENSKTEEYSLISDTLTFNSDYRAPCYIGVVNNGLGTGVEIDDAWVADSGSTTEVELYAIAVDVTGRTIPEFSSAAGFNRHEFAKALDNAAFKKILEKNYWADLRFKVKIVKSSQFTSL